MGQCTSHAEELPPVRSQAEVISTRPYFQANNSILLLGPQNSGKSTLLRQLWLLYGESYDENERRSYIRHIENTILVSIIDLCLHYLRFYQTSLPHTPMPVVESLVEEDEGIGAEPSDHDNGNDPVTPLQAGKSGKDVGDMAPLDIVDARDSNQTSPSQTSQISPMLGGGSTARTSLNTSPSSSPKVLRPSPHQQQRNLDTSLSTSSGPLLRGIHSSPLSPSSPSGNTNVAKHVFPHDLIDAFSFFLGLVEKKAHFLKNTDDTILPLKGTSLSQEQQQQQQTQKVENEDGEDEDNECLEPTPVLSQFTPEIAQYIVTIWNHPHVQYLWHHRNALRVHIYDSVIIFLESYVKLALTNDQFTYIPSDDDLVLMKFFHHNAATYDFDLQDLLPLMSDEFLEGERYSLCNSTQNIEQPGDGHDNTTAKPTQRGRRRDIDDGDDDENDTTTPMNNDQESVAQPSKETVNSTEDTTPPLNDVTDAVIMTAPLSSPARHVQPLSDDIKDDQQVVALPLATTTASGGDTDVFDTNGLLTTPRHDTDASPLLDDTLDNDYDNSTSFSSLVLPNDMTKLKSATATTTASPDSTNRTLQSSTKEKPEVIEEHQHEHDGHPTLAPSTPTPQQRHKQSSSSSHSQNDSSFSPSAQDRSMVGSPYATPTPSRHKPAINIHTAAGTTTTRSSGKQPPLSPQNEYSSRYSNSALSGNDNNDGDDDDQANGRGRSTMRSYGRQSRQSYASVSRSTRNQYSKVSSAIIKSPELSVTRNSMENSRRGSRAGGAGNIGLELTPYGDIDESNGMIYNPQFKNGHVRLYDVKGERCHRRKWLHHYNNVGLIYYLVPIGEYNQYIAEECCITQSKSDYCDNIIGNMNLSVASSTFHRPIDVTDDAWETFQHDSNDIDRKHYQLEILSPPIDLIDPHNPIDHDGDILDDEMDELPQPTIQLAASDITPSTSTSGLTGALSVEDFHKISQQPRPGSSQDAATANDSRESSTRPISADNSLRMSEESSQGQGQGQAILSTALMPPPLGSATSNTSATPQTPNSSRKPHRTIRSPSVSASTRSNRRALAHTRTLRIEDALKQFQQICNSHHFYHHTEIVLVFTKYDLLHEKVNDPTIPPFTYYYPDFTGDVKNPQDIVSYFHELFQSQNKTQKPLQIITLYNGLVNISDHYEEYNIVMHNEQFTAWKEQYIGFGYLEENLQYEINQDTGLTTVNVLMNEGESLFLRPLYRLVKKNQKGIQCGQAQIG